MSAAPERACHHCRNAGSSLSQGLKFQAAVGSVSFSLFSVGFISALWFPSLLHQFMGSVSDRKLKVDVI